jgi:hypothetical protein
MLCFLEGVMVEQNDAYMAAFRGFFASALRWEDLDRLWQTLRSQADDCWYVYAVGETPPAAPMSAAQFTTFLVEMDTLLRRDHDEDYCGIVYADDMDSPTMVKIYDPHNLGSSCGSGSHPPPLPGWVLSRLAPPGLEAMQPTASRRRWWQRLFA